MANAAKVGSIEALDSFLARLTAFQDRLGKQLDEVRTEVHRVVQCLEAEAPQYWQEQDRLAKRRWTEARERMMECEATVRADERPGCSEHRKRLDRCTVRVALCEKKLRQLKQCQLLWQQVSTQLQMKIQHVRDLEESRLPIARMHLKQIIDPLLQYAQLGASNATSNASEIVSNLTTMPDANATASESTSSLPQEPS